MDEQDIFTSMEQRYRSGDLPWDQPLPPPEVIALAGELPPGRALDLGCGAGRASIYLAQQGWTCDGVDFVPEAVALAEQRAREAGVAERVQFHLAPVTQLDGLQPPYDLAIDVGCMHNLRGDDLRAYRGEVARLVSPGGRYLLFAHLIEAGAAPQRRGLPEQTILDIFTPTFSFERIEHGQTTVGNSTPWPSAWFWLRR